MLGSQVSNKTIFYMTGFVIVGIALIFIFNFLQIFSFPLNEKFVAYNDVRGIAVEHHNLLYTLNFDQQNQLIEYVNMGLPVGKAALTQSKDPLPFTKIIVYRFDQPDLVMTPIEIDNQNLVFSVPQWNPNGYIKDVTLGKLNQLIAGTYNP
jgi:hypothetical protein